MTRRFFSGNSLEQAVMLAARHHGVEPEELDYHKVEKKHGFLRTRRAVVIAVDPENPRRPEGAGAPAAAPEPPPGSSEASAAETVPTPTPPSETRRAAPAERMAREEPAPAERRPEPAPRRAPRPAPRREPVTIDDELLRAAERATGHLLALAGVEAQATARPGDERVEVDISGPEEAELLAEDGRVLLAIQHLLPRMLRGLTGRSSFVRADCGGFHEERRQRLAELARREAEEARREGRPRILEPMAPDERRLVHLALADEPTVETESRGGGWHKRVVIRPVGEHERD